MSVISLRRLRRNPQIRSLVAETRLRAEDLILPYFVIDWKDRREPISSMLGIYRFSADNLLKELDEVKALGIKAVLLFGIPDKKDNAASESYSDNGVVQKAIRRIRKEIKGIVIITDVCMCSYTLHGHCGVIKKSKLHAGTRDFYIDNDGTLKILAKIAVSHATAGADFVAPSAMMDGQVSAIRDAMDKKGFSDTGILAYSAKFASNFYGLFRNALDSAPQFGDRKSYQMDFRNSKEALREIEQDINEGADIVMVKPALAYLDIIYRAKEKFNIPIAAYNVSGEYSMIKKLTSGDKAKERELVLEALTSMKRAGADLIITYFAKEVGKWLGRR